jgi:NAD(P)-dependent dehydrogenase (short-subunit alcohol dehydrogenase family)
MTQEKKQRGPTVAITGAGSGLGRELALGFSAKGYRVFGTVQSANERHVMLQDKLETQSMSSILYEVD